MFSDHPPSEIRLLYDSRCVFIMQRKIIKLKKYSRVTWKKLIIFKSSTMIPKKNEWQFAVVPVSSPGLNALKFVKNYFLQQKENKRVNTSTLYLFIC